MAKNTVISIMDKVSRKNARRLMVGLIVILSVGTFIGIQMKKMPDLPKEPVIKKDVLNYSVLFTNLKELKKDSLLTQLRITEVVDFTKLEKREISEKTFVEDMLFWGRVAQSELILSETNKFKPSEDFHKKLIASSENKKRSFNDYLLAEIFNYKWLSMQSTAISKLSLFEKSQVLLSYSLIARNYNLPIFNELTNQIMTELCDQASKLKSNDLILISWSAFNYPPSIYKNENKYKIYASMQKNKVLSQELNFIWSKINLE